LIENSLEVWPSGLNGNVGRLKAAMFQIALVKLSVKNTENWKNGFLKLSKTSSMERTPHAIVQFTFHIQ
jgi:hypothetical protein